MLFTNGNDERGALCGCGPRGLADGDDGRLSRPLSLAVVLGAEHHGDALLEHLCGGEEEDAVDPPLGPLDGLLILFPTLGHGARFGLLGGGVRGGESPLVPLGVVYDLFGRAGLEVLCGLGGGAPESGA
eukprot:254440-Alexandrium_andersonii.AAC.1